MPVSVMRSVLLALCAVGAAPALACTILYGTYRPSLWHRLTDFRPPTAPRVLAGPVGLRRGTAGVVGENGVVYQTSCDDLGFFQVWVAPSQDNRTRSAELGYAIEVVRGTMPERGDWDRIIAAPLDPRKAMLDTLTLPFSWIDGADAQQEPLDVSFVLRAVDRAGRRSAPSDTLTVVDPGR